MSKSYGKVGWDDNNDNSKKNRFVTLVNGGNEIRIISDVYKYLTHRVKFEGDTNKFGRNIKCAVNDCPLCKEQHPVKSKYIAAVLMEGDVKLLDMGTLLYNKIRGIKTHMKGFEDPKDYSINVIRDPQGGPQGFYQAFPAEKGPLTAEQMAIVEEKFDENDLEDFCTPPEPEQVKTSIERIASFIKNSSTAPATGGESEAKKESVVSDGDYDFVVKRT